ncbi:hypothetical protein LSP04_13540 [Levilactobacillus spicheri]|uniref:Uncharacterized protein n=1 Tax=Levilactobacillus spicheri TaxID=216463 RepID=A0ABQ0WQQ0_9LACO|nr:hypothetical protein LSP04_13540 [Levilactobacillus spicheri]
MGNLEVRLAEQSFEPERVILDAFIWQGATSMWDVHSSGQFTEVGKGNDDVSETEAT